MNDMSLLRSNIGPHITTKATPSVRSKCLNFSDITTEASVDTMKVAQLLCEQYWRHHSTDWAIEHLFNYIDPHHPDLCHLYDKSLQELQSWEFQFGATPKFQLAVRLSAELNINFTILNGIISEYELIDPAHSLRESLDKLVGTRLKHSDLNQVFDRFNLCQLDSHLANLLNFFNKNIS